MLYDFLLSEKIDVYIFHVQTFLVVCADIFGTWHIMFDGMEIFKVQKIVLYYEKRIKERSYRDSINFDPREIKMEFLFFRFFLLTSTSRVRFHSWLFPKIPSYILSCADIANTIDQRNII
jgi:hypothetical protein